MTPEQQLDTLLARARLHLDQEDRERLLKNLPFYESQLAELRIPEARYAEPAVRFKAGS